MASAGVPGATRRIPRSDRDVAQAQPQRVYPPNPKGYTLSTSEGIPFCSKTVYPFGFGPYTRLGSDRVPFLVLTVYPFGSDSAAAAVG